MQRWWLRLALLVVTGSLMPQFPVDAESLPNLFPFPNSTGLLETYNTAGGPISLSRDRSSSLWVRMGEVALRVTGRRRVGASRAMK